MINLINDKVSDLFEEWYDRFAGPGEEWTMPGFLDWLEEEHGLVIALKSRGSEPGATS